MPISELIAALADKHLPVLREHYRGQAVMSWFKLHGWDVHNEEYQRSATRQVFLNLVMGQLSPGVRIFPSPLDSLAPSSALTELANSLEREASEAESWALPYLRLIPQAHRRHIGQFWTEDPIADWMTAWLLQVKPRKVLDIGCGAGSFLVQLAKGIDAQGLPTQLVGLDVSPVLLNATAATFATAGMKGPHLELRDYLAYEIPSDVDAVICNPPSTRHHSIPPATKDQLQQEFRDGFGMVVSRQGTMAFYFLLKIIAEMPEGARAAVIVPMEVLDARYGKAARRILSWHTELSAVIHFSENMNAFQKVDVGACILLFTKGRKEHNLVKHLTLNALPDTGELLDVLNSEKPSQPPFATLTVRPQRDLDEIPKWFSIGCPQAAEWQNSGLVVPLKELATVMRGIATGANDFFTLSAPDLARLRLKRYVVRTIQRNREIQDILLDEARWRELGQEGKRVWLLYLNGETVQDDPILEEYLAEGERLGFCNRSLLKTRKCWYMMEQREIPPIFFTILTRGNPRFILNQAGVRPLNMFSLIYPKPAIIKGKATELLWALLNSEFSLSKLHSVSRTYGGRTLKVEPRELDNLPVVNPLSLSDGQRSALQSVIVGYFASRDVAYLTREVSRFVATLLSHKPLRRHPPSRLKQLMLCESPAPYKAQGRTAKRKR